MKKIISFVVCLFSTWLQARVSAYDPTGLTNYEWIDRLEAYSCAFPTARLSHPQSHWDLRSAIDIGNGQEMCTAPAWLLKERDVMLRPLLAPDATASFFSSQYDTLALQNLEASITPLFPLRHGRPTAEGANLLLEFSPSAESGDNFGIALAATPGFIARLEDYRVPTSRFYLYEAYAKVGYKWTELLIGRLGLDFGVAKHGNLLLSRAAKPLNQVRFSVRPHVLGSGFSFLGPFSFETFYSWAGESQFVSNNKLLGVQLSLRPTIGFELGLLELFQFGGDSVQSLGGGEFLSMLAYSGASELDRLRRRAFSIHLSVWLPSNYARVYAQTLFDSLGSTSDWLGRDLSTLLGLWFPRLGAAEVRLEFVHTQPTAYSGNIYRQGLTYEKTLLGHPLGNDGEAVFLDIGLPDLAGLRPTLKGAFESRLRHPGAGKSTEWRYGGGIDLRKRWERMEIQIDSNYAHIENHMYVNGQRNDVVGVLGMVRYSFP